MKTLTKIIGVAGLMAISGVVGAASYITVNGITWDPDATWGFTGVDYSSDSSSGNVIQIDQPVASSTTRTLFGAGIISSINNTNDFAASGLKLVYEFGGFSYTYDDSNADDVYGSANTTRIVAHGGWINFFVDSNGIDSNLSDGLNLSSFADGVHWLTLKAKDTTDTSASSTNGITGTLFIDGDMGSPSLFPLNNGQGNALFDVSSLIDTFGSVAIGHMGTASANFDTNSITGLNTTLFNLALTNSNNPADFSFTSNLSTTTTAGSSIRLGQATIVGNSIPEPTSLALLGLGMLGFGAVRRKTA